MKPSCVPISQERADTQIPCMGTDNHGPARRCVGQLEAVHVAAEHEIAGLLPDRRVRLGDLSDFADCLYTRQAANNVPLFDVLQDASAGTLPNFAIVTPTSKLSQHNGYSMLNGDNYIGQIMSALMHGPEWNSTAVIITYDDYGGFYDHVPSPDGTDAIRLPFIIVSPWAKPGYTDHTYGSLDSIDAFVEHTFGLQPLTARDASAYNLHHAFDFAQLPPPAVPMTRTPVHRELNSALSDATRRRQTSPKADTTCPRLGTINSGVLAVRPDGNSVPISAVAPVAAPPIRSRIGDAPRDSFVIRLGYAISRL